MKTLPIQVFVLANCRRIRWRLTPTSHGTVHAPYIGGKCIRSTYRTLRKRGWLHLGGGHIVTRTPAGHEVLKTNVYAEAYSYSFASPQ